MALPFVSRCSPVSVIIFARLLRKSLELLQEVFALLVVWQSILFDFWQLYRVPRLVHKVQDELEVILSRSCLGHLHLKQSF